MNRTEQLRQIMADYELKPKEVGQILKRSTQTVRIWLCISDREIPEHALELLRAKVEAQ